MKKKVLIKDLAGLNVPRNTGQKKFQQWLIPWLMEQTKRTRLLNQVTPENNGSHLFQGGAAISAPPPRQVVIHPPCNS